MKKSFLKLLTLATLLALALLALASCFGGDNTGDGGGDEPPADDGRLTVYSDEVAVPIVISLNSTELESTLANTLKNAIALKAESDPTLSYDTLATPEGVIEIAIGKTKRPATEFAEQYIAETFDGDGFAYLICYKDGAVAIAGSDEFALELAVNDFIEKYVKDTSLVIEESFFDYVSYTEKEYKDMLYADRKAEELKNYEDRWAEVDAKLPADVAKALKTYYSIYGTEIVEWFGNLYDPETGAFYYSNSARDYQGFLPDIESTYQVIKDLRNAGCFRIYDEGDSYKAVSNALPTEVREKLITFVQAMQDPDDGYFYHTQWGKKIGTERRDRDLTWAVNMFKFLDSEPLYPTALDRLQGATKTSAAISAMMSEVHPTASLPSYLQSREAFFAWLDTMNFKKDSHGYGHTVGSMSNQIKAAGLLDDAIEYFNALQTEVYNEMKAAYDADPVKNPKPTGLWQKEVNYTSLSGLFKIGILYGDADAPIQYADLAVESAIQCILSDEDPKTVIYAYNPWAGLGTAISSIKRANNAATGAKPYDYDAIHARIMENAAEMIRKTTEKFLLFKQDDGAFSYYQDYAAPNTQGTYVSLGVAEGDVNATTVAMDGASSIFGAFGVSKPQLWTATDLDVFLGIVESSLPIVKTELDTDVTRDFEEYGEGDIPELSTVNGGTVTGVTTDPENPSNKVFKFDYPGAQSTGYYYNLNTNYSDADVYLFESDCYMESASGGTTHQIQVRSKSGPVYMLTFAVSGGYVVIDDCSTINSGARKSGMNILVPVKTWFKLGIELYNDGTPEGFKVKVYLDGKCVFISTNFYNSHEAGAVPERGFANLQIYAMRAPSSSLLLDNVHTDVLSNKTFDDSDLGAGNETAGDSVTYDFESSSVGYMPLLNYPGSTSEVKDDPTGAGKGKVVAVTKSNSDTGLTDDMRFDCPPKKGAQLTWSADIYIDELSFADNSYTAMYQINLGGMGSSCAYMMTLVYDVGGGFVYIGDASSTGSGTTNAYKEARIELDKWYNIKVVLNMSTDPAAFSADIYLDGTKVATSNNFYGSEKPDAKPNAAGDSVTVRVQRRVIYKAYLDNVSISFT